jgi:serine/threonine protein kinase
MAKRAEREQSDSAARRERDTIVSQPGFAPAELEAAPTPHVELPPDVTPPIPLANLSRTVGSYVLLDEIGRGGAGVVYRAWQLSLKRVVALKMILTGTHSRADMRARFRAEAELAAQIHHPNVVQIYEIGEQDDLPYFSLEYLEGGTLSRKIDGVPLPPREAARIVRDIAYGVSAAHEQGLVHRDLKPANILMTPGGIPKITDFGLAKNLDAQGHTISGTILGTPSYMSPEQAKGNPHVAPATDIYSMGAMLYEMLTGKPPFRGETVVDTLEQVRTEMPTPPSQRNSEVPRDLELICLTCLRKDPSQRYPSAQALADDLQAFLVGDPIAARAESWHERMRRVVQESPLTLFIIAASGCPTRCSAACARRPAPSWAAASSTRGCGRGCTTATKASAPPSAPSSACTSCSSALLSSWRRATWTPSCACWPRRLATWSTPSMRRFTWSITNGASCGHRRCSTSA